jgi:hypothetical protein
MRGAADRNSTGKPFALALVPFVPCFAALTAFTAFTALAAFTAFAAFAAFACFAPFTLRRWLAEAGAGAEALLVVFRVVAVRPFDPFDRAVRVCSPLNRCLPKRES